MKIKLVAIILFSSIMAYGQNDIGQFAIWKPKEEKLTDFENGYKRHLQWHKDNGEKWSWYGWFIISGERYGQFVDATFDLNWADFDNAVNPAGDMKDNRLNVFPYADVQTVFKVKHLKQFSSPDSYSGKLKLSRMLTITVSDINKTSDLLAKLQKTLKAKNIKSINVFKTVDGGSLNKLIVMLGYSNWEEFETSGDILEDITALENNLNEKIIQSIHSETMAYRDDLSYLQ